PEEVEGGCGGPRQRKPHNLRSPDQKPPPALRSASPPVQDAAEPAVRLQPASWQAKRSPSHQSASTVNALRIPRGENSGASSNLSKGTSHQFCINVVGHPLEFSALTQPGVGAVFALRKFSRPIQNFCVKDRKSTRLNSSHLG